MARIRDADDMTGPFTAVDMDKLPEDAKNGETTPEDIKPKRRGRPPRDPNAPASQRGRRPKSLETQIGSALMTFNIPLWAFPQTRNDALDDAEIQALAKALDQQARVSPTFRKYLVGALEATSGGQLVSVLLVITARRMARHEFIFPKEADNALGKMLGAAVNAPDMTPPEPIETPEPSNDTTD